MCGPPCRASLPSLRVAPVSAVADLPLCHEAPVAPQSPARVDVNALARDLDALRETVREETREASLPHLRRIKRIGRLAAALGLVLAVWAVNPISIVLLAFASFVRWAVVA